MRWIKRTLFALLALLLLVLIAIIGTVGVLNTQGGQNFAVRQINKFGEGSIHLSGLSGHFPYNLQLQNLQLIDHDGIWLNAKQIKLDWSPLVLLRRHLFIQTLTAQTIDVMRSPNYPPAKSKKTTGTGFSFPHLSITLNELKIETLELGPALAGQTMQLHVTGNAALPNFYNANIALNITSEHDIGVYQLAGTLTSKTVSLNLLINEKPGGLIGHLIDPEEQAPFKLTTTLAGPRNKVQLNGSAQFGAANITINGLLGLNQSAPSAELHMIIPALAPFSKLAGLPFDGNSTVNFTAAQPLHSNRINFSIAGQLKLTKAPEKLKKLLLGDTTLNVIGSTRNNRTTLKSLILHAPGFSFISSGMLSKKHINLNSSAKIKNISDLLPDLRGQLDLETQILGPLHNMHAKAQLNGQLFPPGGPADPFSITLHAWNLPDTPYGTLSGSGSLAGAPLSLAAKFSYNAKAISRLDLQKLDWKSLAAHADLKLKAGSNLPTGVGDISFTRLSDLDPLIEKKLSGAVETHFSYQKNKILNLTVDAKNTSFGDDIKGLNGNLQADGTLDALALRLDAGIAKLIGQPTKAALAGELNLTAQTLNINDLSGDWHGLTARLLTPALFEMKPDLAIRHLQLSLARANIAVDGTFSPILNVKTSIKNIDLSFLQKMFPKLNCAGLINLNATLTGLLTAPQGQIALQATGLRYLTPETSQLPPATLSGSAVLKGQSADLKLQLGAGHQASASVQGNAPFSMDAPLNLKLTSNFAASLLNQLLTSQNMKLNGEILLNAHLTGTPANPAGLITLQASNIHSATGIAAGIPPANLDARADVKNKSARLNITLTAGSDANFMTLGNVPLVMTSPVNLQTDGQLNLKILDPLLAGGGSLLRGIINTQFSITGRASSPQLNGVMNLSDGSILNVTSGLNLTSINASLQAANKIISLQSLSAVAGHGKITGYGRINLAESSLPVDLALNAERATPVSSDLLTETLNAALTLKGSLKTGTVLAGSVDILKANINIPRSLPPSIANLPIHYEGDLPAAPKASSQSISPITLALDLKAHNQVFIRGDGLFAELGGHIIVNGTSAHPIPTGGFSLIRGSFSLAGKTLQFTEGKVDFNGDGFVPALNLEATTATSNGGNASLTVSGTASKPKISLSSSPPLPSDEILAQLLFAQNSDNLSPFQAASLAAALAQISGVGGGFSPLESTRNALGLDELSVGSSDKGSPSVQAGRYIAPGVYVGASQSATGQGSKANVEINLYKGLKLQSSTGTDSTGQSSSSVGLGYQFNY